MWWLVFIHFIYFMLFTHLFIQTFSVLNYNKKVIDRENIELVAY